MRIQKFENQMDCDMLIFENLTHQNFYKYNLNCNTRAFCFINCSPSMISKIITKDSIRHINEIFIIGELPKAIQTSDKKIRLYHDEKLDQFYGYEMIRVEGNHLEEMINQIVVKNLPTQFSFLKIHKRLRKYPIDTLFIFSN